MAESAETVSGRRSRLREELLKELRDRRDPTDEEIRRLIDVMLQRESPRGGLSIAERLSLSRELFSSVRKLDVLEELIEDKTVTEIMVNGPKCIFIERNGKVGRWEKSFESEEKLRDVIQQIVGSCNRVINEQNPIADAHLPDGSRVNAVVPPAALDGPILTIRQFPEHPILMEDLIRRGSITEEAAQFLARLVRARYSMIIGGGTSAGKTTFLNALASFIPKEERVITIEDNAELQIRGIPNLVRLEAKEANHPGAAFVQIRDLIKSALRMRPDRIIVGEVRSGEAVDMLQAMNTGHEGSLSTVHCNSCADCCARLETMTLMAFPLPLPAIRRQIAGGVNIFLHLGRMRNGKRQVLEIAETDGIRDGEVRLHTMFRWDDRLGRLVRTGGLIHLTKLARSGETEEVIREMADKRMRDNEKRAEAGETE